MKSIMEEASSVAKAIENGWIKAGKPKEFSINIFEQPERNFFGITIKNAKIAIIFDEKQSTQTKDPVAKKTKSKKQSNKLSSNESRRPRTAQKASPSYQSEETPVWDDEMISFATKWLRDLLSSIDKKSIHFTSEINRDQLVIYFNNQIIEQEDRNKRCMRHLAQLLVQTMRNNLKKSLRGYKIIMKTK